MSWRWSRSTLATAGGQSSVEGWKGAAAVAVGLMVAAQDWDVAGNGAA